MYLLDSFFAYLSIYIVVSASNERPRTHTKRQHFQALGSGTIFPCIPRHLRRFEKSHRESHNPRLTRLADIFSWPHLTYRQTLSSMHLSQSKTAGVFHAVLAPGAWLAQMPARSQKDVSSKVALQQPRVRPVGGCSVQTFCCSMLMNAARTVHRCEQSIVQANTKIEILRMPAYLSRPRIILMMFMTDDGTLFPELPDLRILYSGQEGLCGADPRLGAAGCPQQRGDGPKLPELKVAEDLEL